MTVFLLVGVLAGPYGVGIIPLEAQPGLGLVDWLALPFIAFSAGAELRLESLKGALRTIAAVVSLGGAAVFLLSSLVFFGLAPFVSFMKDAKLEEQLAAAFLAANVMMAISPSAAIAVIREDGASGRFSTILLGTIVLMDAVVIVLFGINSSIAHVLLSGLGFDLLSSSLVLIELFLDLSLGLLLACALHFALRHLPRQSVRTVLVLCAGFGLFVTSGLFGRLHVPGTSLRVFSEPLLSCMTAGFLLANFSRYGGDFTSILHKSGSVVFLFFFTALGIRMNLSVLSQNWFLVLGLAVVRALGMWAGGWAAFAAAGEEHPGGRYLGFGLLAQAGISVGIAREIAAEFPAFGADMEAACLGVIIVNTLLGPPFLRHVLKLSGDTLRKPDEVFEAKRRRVLIFGIDNRAVILSRELLEAACEVQLIGREEREIRLAAGEGLPAALCPQLDCNQLKQFGLDEESAVVLMLDGGENVRAAEELRKCSRELSIVADAAAKAADLNRLKALGVKTVDPATASLRLIEQYIKSPLTAETMLERTDQPFLDITLRNRGLHGAVLRDLHIPPGLSVINIKRKGERLLPHGGVKLRLGDELTVVGEAAHTELLKLQLERRAPWVSLLPRIPFT